MRAAFLKYFWDIKKMFSIWEHFLLVVFFSLFSVNSIFPASLPQNMHFWKERPEFSLAADESHPLAKSRVEMKSLNNSFPHKNNLFYTCLICTFSTYFADTVTLVLAFFSCNICHFCTMAARECCISKWFMSSKFPISDKLEIIDF